MHQMKNKAYKCCFLYTLNSFTVFLDEKTKKIDLFSARPWKKEFYEKNFLEFSLQPIEKTILYL